jgi:hypothetical protein
MKKYNKKRFILKPAVWYMSEILASQEVEI